MGDDTSGSVIRIRASDGFELGAYQAAPEGRAAGAVVVIQEIFGVNRHVREVADGFAAEGYLAIAPKLFDRVERDVELGYQGDDLQRGIELAFQKLDHDAALEDLRATVAEAARAGRVGIVGYCFGGLMAWRAASEVDGLAAAVSYYGGGVTREAGRRPRCPVMMHFGEKDAHIPLAEVDELKAAQPDVELHVYPADHGFNCDHRASYHQESAALARRRTLEFFARHLR